jgi:hypothetical protein
VGEDQQSISGRSGDPEVKPTSKFKNTLDRFYLWQKYSGLTNSIIY